MEPANSSTSTVTIDGEAKVLISEHIANDNGYQVHTIQVVNDLNEIVQEFTVRADQITLIKL